MGSGYRLLLRMLVREETEERFGQGEGVPGHADFDNACHPHPLCTASTSP